MKQLFIISAICLLGCRVWGAGEMRMQRSILYRTYQVHDDRTQMEKIQDDLKYYRGMKATGAALTGTGGALAAGGLSLFWTSVALNETGKRSYTPFARDPLFISGLAATALSAIPFAFGIPLLRYGTKKVKALKIELKHYHKYYFRS